MTNKILITVVVPTIEESYDIYIPVSKSIKLTIDLLVQTINELSLGHFPKKQNCKLLSSAGVVYNKTFNIKQCGIKNGDRVILI